MSESKDRKTPRDLLRTIFQRMTLFLFTAGLVAILCSVLAHGMPTSYTSHRKFQRVDNEAVSMGAGADKGAAFDDVMRSTVVSELKRVEAIRKAARANGMLRDLPIDETGELTPEGKRIEQERIAEWTENLSIEWVSKTDPVDEIKVSFTHSDPEIARDFLNTLVDNYMKAFATWVHGELTAQVDLVTIEEQNAFSELTAARHKRRTFEEEHPHVTEDPAAIKQSIEELEQERRRIQRNLKIERMKLEGLETMKKQIEAGPGGPPIKTDNAKAAKLFEKREEIQEDLDRSKESLHQMRIVNRMTEAHPDVVKMKMYIAEQEKRIADLDKQIEAIPDVQRQGQVGYDLSLRLQLTQNSIQAMEGDLERIDDKLALRNRARADYDRYRRELEILIRAEESAESNYQSVRGELNALKRRMLEETGRNRTRLNTIAKATAQQKPSSPKFLMILGGSILLGLAAGAGLVFLGHMLDRTISTPEEASQHFGLPIHGVIGEIVTPAQKRYRRLRRRFVIPVVGLVILLALGLGLMSNYLRLEKPDRYRQWAADPIHFLSENLVEPVLSKAPGH